eukprot:1157036-Pelagomonas_calceolata.AAC.1
MESRLPLILAAEVTQGQGLDWKVTQGQGLDWNITPGQGLDWSKLSLVASTDELKAEEAMQHLGSGDNESGTPEAQGQEPAAFQVCVWRRAHTQLLAGSMFPSLFLDLAAFQVFVERRTIDSSAKCLLSAATAPPLFYIPCDNGPYVRGCSSTWELDWVALDYVEPANVDEGGREHGVFSKFFLHGVGQIRKWYKARSCTYRMLGPWVPKALDGLFQLRAEPDVRSMDKQEKTRNKVTGTCCSKSIQQDPAIPSFLCGVDALIPSLMELISALHLFDDVHMTEVGPSQAQCVYLLMNQEQWSMLGCNKEGMDVNSGGTVFFCLFDLPDFRPSSAPCQRSSNSAATAQPSTNSSAPTTAPTTANLSKASLQRCGCMPTPLSGLSGSTAADRGLFRRSTTSVEDEKEGVRTKDLRRSWGGGAQGEGSLTARTSMGSRLQSSSTGIAFRRSSSSTESKRAASARVDASLQNVGRAGVRGQRGPLALETVPSASVMTAWGEDGGDVTDFKSKVGNLDRRTYSRSSSNSSCSSSSIVISGASVPTKEGSEERDSSGQGSKEGKAERRDDAWGTGTLVDLEERERKGVRSSLSGASGARSGSRKREGVAVLKFAGVACSKTRSVSCELKAEGCGKFAYAQLACKRGRVTSLCTFVAVRLGLGPVCVGVASFRVQGCPGWMSSRAGVQQQGPPGQDNLTPVHALFPSDLQYESARSCLLLLEVWHTHALGTGKLQAPEPISDSSSKNGQRFLRATLLAGSRLLAQAEQLAGELARHVGVAAPPSRVIHQVQNHNMAIL